GDRERILSEGRGMGYVIEPTSIVEAAGDQEAAFKAVELIRLGKGDFLMKGRMETGILLREVVNKETGIGKGGVMSHLCILQIPTYHKIVGFSDGGMIVNPDFTQKVSLLENALGLFRGLGYTHPKVAVVAAVETMNPKMPETKDGAELKKMAQAGKLGDCYVEGPISFDLIFSKEAAKIKGFESPVTGDVDLVIVPNLAVGNIMTKALICLGGALMAGCVLGAKVPIVLSSRSASYEEKFYSLMLCATQA
ncbi:MAG: phosphate acyltransferase, partial [Anaerovorax sp.]